MYNDELYHFGVKGMRWGHRKNNYNAIQRLGMHQAQTRSAKLGIRIGEKIKSKRSSTEQSNNSSNQNKKQKKPFHQYLCQFQYFQDQKIQYHYQ